MAKKKRNLTEGTTMWLDPTDKYGESRFVQEVFKRGNESFVEMDEQIYEYGYRRIYSDYDCTGQWFTMNHFLARAGEYWIVRYKERIDC